MEKREIKFRAFDYGKMITMPIYSLYELECFFTILSDEAKLMQYTGLKDKNGVEIYEGDILKLIKEYTGKGENPSYVIFKNAQWMMQGLMHYSHVDSINNYALDKMEVIGNIYQHPHLLSTPQG